ncbi:hypothetical protein [Streptomyces nanshensis]|uniref:Secreted protein n=1 Tax=Streptomyces nanshensis TaxID=518642 RepID=A0A1E7LCU5_9ACTN|nr:hypothetical protein [Streptomyces nanshensis]OEV13793.1 hypothetical protein AN218_01800 [Streptomyces nanshensis]
MKTLLCRTGTRIATTTAVSVLALCAAVGNASTAQAADASRHLSDGSGYVQYQDRGNALTVKDTKRDGRAVRVNLWTDYGYMHTVNMKLGAGNSETYYLDLREDRHVEFVAITWDHNGDQGGGPGLGNAQFATRS